MLRRRRKPLSHADRIKQRFREDQKMARKRETTAAYLQATVSVALSEGLTYPQIARETGIGVEVLRAIARR